MNMVETARKLRSNMTRAETLLWSRLRRKRLGVKFRRQHPIAGFVADFACIQRRLIVEVDGDVHDAHEERDGTRSEMLIERGWRILRVRNDEVICHLDDVVNRIRSAVLSGR